MSDRRYNPDDYTIDVVESLRVAREQREGFDLHRRRNRTFGAHEVTVEGEGSVLSSPRHRDREEFAT